MLNDASGFDRIYIACGYTNLRYGIDGLAAVIKETFQEDPFVYNAIFLFCGRKKDRIKALVWEGDGFLLLYKRLERGRFIWPMSYDDLRGLDESSFRRLMEGFSVDSSIEKIPAPKHIV